MMFPATKEQSRQALEMARELAKQGVYFVIVIPDTEEEAIKLHEERLAKHMKQLEEGF